MLRCPETRDRWQQVRIRCGPNKIRKQTNSHVRVRNSYEFLPKMGKLCTYRILFVVVVLYSQHFRRQKTSEVEEKCKLKLNETMIVPDLKRSFCVEYDE